MNELLLIELALVVVFGIAAQWIAYHLKLPSILLLLLFGFLVGPISGIVQPDKSFGDILLPLVSLSVAIILYEGGLSLKFSELKVAGKPILNLIIIGIPITWLLSSAATYFIIGLSLQLSILFGAILVVTGPTVVLPLLRQIQPKGQLNSILKWEGIINDPIGAILAIIVFEIILSPGLQQATVSTAISILKIVFLSTLLGAAGAAILILLIRYRLLPDYLQNPASLAMVMLVFASANGIQKESGLLAVTMMGIIMANQRYVTVRHIIEFKENLRVLLISILFIVLAARRPLTDFQVINLDTILFLVALILVVRPLSVFISTIGLKLSLKEKFFISWMAPRGIVAAAVASIFALELTTAGVADAKMLAPLTILVIIATIVVYGFTARPLASWLGLADPDAQGCLIISASKPARIIASALKSLGIRALLVDTNWDNVTAARQEGLEVHHGNILGENELEQVNFQGLGKLLAVTSNKEVNSLAALRFIHLFGSSEVYQLALTKKGEKKKHGISQELRGELLFGKYCNYDFLTDVIMRQDKLKTTKITEKYSYEHLKEQAGGKTILPLFLYTSQKKLRVYTGSETPEPKAGDTLISVEVPADSSYHSPLEEDEEKE